MEESSHLLTDSLKVIREGDAAIGGRGEPEPMETQLSTVQSHGTVSPLLLIRKLLHMGIGIILKVALHKRKRLLRCIFFFQLVTVSEFATDSFLSHTTLRGRRLFYGLPTRLRRLSLLIFICTAGGVVKSLCGDT